MAIKFGWTRKHKDTPGSEAVDVARVMVSFMLDHEELAGALISGVLPLDEDDLEDLRKPVIEDTIRFQLKTKGLVACHYWLDNYATEVVDAGDVSQAQVLEWALRQVDRITVK
jgi:hypothetical protein